MKGRHRDPFNGAQKVLQDWNGTEPCARVGVGGVCSASHPAGRTRGDGETERSHLKRPLTHGCGSEATGLLCLKEPRGQVSRRDITTAAHMDL